MSLQVIHTSASSGSREDAWTQQHCLGAPCGQRLPRLKEWTEETEASTGWWARHGPASQTPPLKRESEPPSTQALTQRTRRIQTTAPWTWRRVLIRVWGRVRGGFWQGLQGLGVAKSASGRDREGGQPGGLRGGTDIGGEDRWEGRAVITFV